MSEYEHSLTIRAAADEVFEFVSKVENLPRYLPTVRQAERQGEGRVRVEGEAAGSEYSDDGYFRIDHAQRRMEWGSDGEHRYHGWLEVSDDSTAGRSAIRVHLSLEPSPELAERFAQQPGGQERAIQESLEDALESVQLICEGRPRGDDRRTEARP